MWNALGCCGKATELQRRLGPAVEQQILPLLGEVLAQFLQLVLAHLVAHREDSRVQTLGCELFAYLANDPAGRTCLQALGTPCEAVVAAARAHPSHAGVQEQVWWALGNLEGVRALRHIEDPLLFKSPVAASFALAMLKHQVRAPRQGAVVHQGQRAELAAATQRIMQEFPDNNELQKRGLRALKEVLGTGATMLKEYGSVVSLIGLLLNTMQRHASASGVVYEAASTLLRLCDGDDGIQQMLRSQPQVQVFLEELLRRHAATGASTDQLQQCLSRLLLLLGGVEGVLGVLERLRQDPSVAEEAVTVLLQALAEAEDEGLAVELGAVRLASELAPAGCSGARAAAAIVAVGRVAELLLLRREDAGSAEAGLQSVRWILERLRQEAYRDEAARKTQIYTYRNAFVALTSCALRSERALGALLEAGVVDVTAKVLEDDYWHFSFDALQRLVYAMALFGGVDTVLRMMGKYPDAPILAEASFHMLTDITDAADPLRDEAVLARCAAPILERCRDAAERFGRRGHYPGVLLRVCGCIGAYLPSALPATEDMGAFVASGSQAALDRSVETMIGILRRFTAAGVTSRESHLMLGAVQGVTQALDATGAGLRREALARALNGQGAAEPLLQVCVQQQCKDPPGLVNEATLALALLQGPEVLLRLLDEHPNARHLQAAAVRGMGELVRRNYAFSDAALRGRAVGALRAAAVDPELEPLAAMALGLVESTA